MQPFFENFEKAVKREKERVAPKYNPILATKIGDDFQRDISPLFSLSKEKSKYKTKTISKHILSFLKNVTLSLSAFPPPKSPSRTKEGLGGKEERWGEVMYFVGLSRNETLSVKETAHLHEFLHMFINLLKKEETGPKADNYIRVALQWAYYLETHWIDPCNMFLGSCPSSSFSSLLFPVCQHPPSWISEKTNHSLDDITRKKEKEWGWENKEEERGRRERERRHFFKKGRRGSPPSSPTNMEKEEGEQVSLKDNARSNNPDSNNNQQSPSPRKEAPPPRRQFSTILPTGQSTASFFGPSSSSSDDIPSSISTRPRSRSPLGSPPLSPMLGGVRKRKGGREVLSPVIPKLDSEERGVEEGEGKQQEEDNEEKDPFILSSLSLSPSFLLNLQGETAWMRWLSYLYSGNISAAVEEMEALATNYCAMRSGELVCVEAEPLAEIFSFSMTKETAKSLIICRLASSITNTSTIAEVFIDPTEVVPAQIPVTAVKGLQRKHLTEPMMRDKTGKIVCFDQKFHYFSHVISHLEGFVKNHLDSKRIFCEFSKLRDLGQAIESKKQLNALCEDKKTIFSLSSNFLRDLNDVSADWLRFCFIFPFCFLPLKPLFLEIESFYSSLVNLIRRELAMYAEQALSSVTTLGDRVRNILSGETKREFCDRWLLYIQEKSNEFMTEIGIDLSALPHNYLATRPVDLKIVEKNCEIAKKCLEGDQTTEEFILKTTEEVHDFLSPFFSDAKEVLNLSPNILANVVGEEEGVEEDLKGLKEDILYLKKMKEMDDKILENRKKGDRERKGLEMSDVVPVAGLIMAQFHICECEHKTALETWGSGTNEPEEQAQEDEDEQYIMIGLLACPPTWSSTPTNKPSRSFLGPSSPSRVSLGRDRNRAEKEKQGEKEGRVGRNRGRGTMNELLQDALTQQKGKRMSLSVREGMRKPTLGEGRYEKKADEAIGKGARGFLAFVEEEPGWPKTTEDLASFSPPSSASSPPVLPPLKPSFPFCSPSPSSPSSSFPSSSPPLSSPSTSLNPLFPPRSPKPLFLSHPASPASPRSFLRSNPPRISTSQSPPLEAPKPVSNQKQSPVVNPLSISDPPPPIIRSSSHRVLSIQKS